MNQLDMQIAAVVKALRDNGAVVGMDENAPDEIKHEFLRMILSCPDCRELALGKHEGRAN